MGNKALFVFPLIQLQVNLNKFNLVKLIVDL